MKIKQHKEKLEIIRDIIRETLLGNAALIVLAAMVPVVLVKPWDSMTFSFYGGRVCFFCSHSVLAGLYSLFVYRNACKEYFYKDFCFFYLGPFC
ncbi:hypothetical protein [Escherichia coli]|uniref:hypothetical protein n=1 Tax=Escherichia coli TaxID=562 RepID=UPI0002AAE481|nr:hypothetical protein [Escherichia coli]EKT92304.1 hypothetical protein CFSAN001632_24473 [Escherichia coli O111:H8 str. CFSAN001632]